MYPIADDDEQKKLRRTGSCSCHPEGMSTSHDNPVSGSLNFGINVIFLVQCLNVNVTFSVEEDVLEKKKISFKRVETELKMRR